MASSISCISNRESQEARIVTPFCPCLLNFLPNKPKEVADLVSTTDGLIVHFYYDGNLPNGRTSVAQAVGHKPMKEAEFKNQRAK